VAPIPSTTVDPWVAISAIATGAATVVAIVAAELAFWQARIAIAARKATVEQATVAREALELQRVQQHQADAPTFALSIEPPQRDQPCWVKITMTDGPLGVSVGISYVNGWIRRISPTEAQRQETPGNTTVRRNMIKNSSAVFEHDAPVDAFAIWSSVIIKSAEVGREDRTWEHVERVDWRAPADPTA
jgi:hypothetical protein